jgi:hypothetical protein
MQTLTAARKVFEFWKILPDFTLTTGLCPPDSGQSVILSVNPFSRSSVNSFRQETAVVMWVKKLLFGILERTAEKT